ncbi:kinase-like domain-containing protein [Chiua virens]|nr:kinase-like domain-containing protein [Chiua virens]
MSLSWPERKDLLSSLLQAHGDEDEGIALDRVLHGQNTIGKTSKTIKIDLLRFNDKDLIVLGTLDRGQFGLIHLVKCTLDGRVYVRKSIERAFALRSREQCSPQIERDILLLARGGNTVWTPHLLCSFQTPTHLNFIMDYAEGGTLWDVLESSPHGGRVLEVDLEWWAPQAVCAIHWCHSQGFAHRDIKPHNFVLTSTFHLRLIDFGSAAPLSPPERDGSQTIPQRHSLVPCGTCDYISPEILQAHEDALLALELSDESIASLISEQPPSICGPETDWWSLGVMLYELAYGITPFFSDDIRTTYLRIMDHETSLQFDKSITVSETCRDLLQRFLTSRERRVGRCSVMEITEHPFFKLTHWASVGADDAPLGLHVPQFTYTTPATDVSYTSTEGQDEDVSHPFHFSTLFQSSVNTSPGWSMLRSTPRASPGSASPKTEAAFIGFSWGPPRDAFLLSEGSTSGRTLEILKTPRPLLSVQFSSYPPHGRHEVPFNHPNAIATPVRPYNATHHHTLPRTSTAGRTPMRRAVSDREAMRQLVDCISMSARKKVLASGRKPRILDSIQPSRTMATKKELRFGPPLVMVSTDRMSCAFPPVLNTPESEVTESGSEGPPSPSPSPRPGSAMSMLSRRSTTPTTYSNRFSLSPPASPQAEEYHDDSDLDDMFSRLESRQSVLLSQLYSMQVQIDQLKDLVEP